MFKQLFIIFAVLTMSCAAPTAGWAQEGETGYDLAYGSVVSVAESQITISEYNYDTDQEEAIMYVVNDNTIFEEMAGIGDLQPGEEVEILYLMEGTQRTAVMVSRYAEEPGMDEGVGADDGQV